MNDLPPLPAGCLTDPHHPLTFTFEGREIPALRGQSIAAALYASGVRTFTRSFKYHRPRGLFCVAGDCPNCLMRVDGRPNVRTCIESARAGQRVEHQNAWPSLDFDVLRVFDKLDRFLPVGFYYKRFHKPRWLWPVFEHVVRHVAGLGQIDVQARPDLDQEVEHLHAEVCVVGGGPAGLAAANAAAEAGAEVLLLERQSVLGGHLLYHGKRLEDVPGLQSFSGRAERRRTLLETTVFGVYEGNLLGAFRGDRLLKVRARQIIVCTGGRQQPLVFPSNDLPGIFLGAGVLRLAHLHGVRAGRRAVVLTDHDDGSTLAEQLQRLDVAVAEVVDLRRFAVRAVGGRQLRAVRKAVVNPDGSGNHAAEQEIACDLLCMASGLQPANELLLQGGMRFRFQQGRWLPDRIVPGLFAAGAAAGTFDLEAQILEGRLRGTEAAAALGHRVDQEQMSAWQRALAERPQGATAARPHAATTAGKCFVCLCEDVTTKDLEQAVAEGFDHIETLKRYATVNMGPCQGKMCGQAAVEACARLTGRDLNTVGTTTSRPPAVPVELGVLAAERRHTPERRTPLHEWHQAAGARWLDAGLWKRPESYGDPAREVRTVRTAAGLIDVGTLGKIEVVGPDAAELLERVYLNRWADLRVGRVRYGVMCNEDGIVFDDGVAARLGPEHFYLTATTGNADAVWQWLELWKATWRLDVTLVNRTAALAAVNLAGPQARAVLGRLTQLDLTSATFPYLALREAEVAGVPCRLLRIGFVGELGYEIHCPAGHAWELWEALVSAGADHGLKPFGVEAQRVLRLEKGHVLVGVDTDALSNPFDAGLGGLVRFDKPLFIGRDVLLRLREMGPRSRLVGFYLADDPRVPSEGCQVVEDGVPAGRVTSARHSPTLGRGIGLAWVPARRAAVGARFAVRWNGRDVPAVVAATPFYDPQGKRLRD
jgi:sarcosine oxidase subunit alpha